MTWEAFPGVTALFVTYLPFFLTGVFYATPIFRIAETPRKSLIAGAAALAVLVALSLADPLGRTTLTLRYGAGAILGLAIAIQLARSARLCAFFTWIGHRSLPIFVGHQLILALIMSFIWPLPQVQALFTHWPVALTGGVAILGALLLHAALMRLGLRWLYVPPKALFTPGHMRHT